MYLCIKVKSFFNVSPSSPLVAYSCSLASAPLARISKTFSSTSPDYLPWYWGSLLFWWENVPFFERGNFFEQVDSFARIMKTSLSWHEDCCWNSCPQNIFFCDFLLKSSFLFQFMENLWRTFDLLYSRSCSKFLITFWPYCCFFELRKAHLTAFCIRAPDIYHLFHLKTNGHSVD